MTTGMLLFKKSDHLPLPFFPFGIGENCLIPHGALPGSLTNFWCDTDPKPNIQLRLDNFIAGRKLCIPALYGISAIFNKGSVPGHIEYWGIQDDLQDIYTEIRKLMRSCNLLKMFGGSGKFMRQRKTQPLYFFSVDGQAYVLKVPQLLHCGRCVVWFLNKQNERKSSERIIKVMFGIPVGQIYTYRYEIFCWYCDGSKTTW